MPPPQFPRGRTSIDQSHSASYPIVRIESSAHLTSSTGRFWGRAALDRLSRYNALYIILPMLSHAHRNDPLFIFRANDVVPLEPNRWHYRDSKNLPLQVLKTLLQRCEEIVTNTWKWINDGVSGHRWPTGRLGRWWWWRSWFALMTRHKRHSWKRWEGIKYSGIKLSESD